MYVNDASERWQGKLFALGEQSILTGCSGKGGKHRVPACTGLDYQLPGTTLQHSQQLKHFFIGAKIVSVKQGISLHNKGQVTDYRRFACGISGKNLWVPSGEQSVQLLSCLFFTAEAAHYSNQSIRSRFVHSLYGFA